MKRKWGPLAIALVASLIYSQNISANWYAGNLRNDAYGARAYILTPIFPPFTTESEESGQSSWVSIPSPWWIQAGWRYYWYYPYPQMYTEFKRSSDGARIIDEHGIHFWGMMKEYKIEHLIHDIWCASIDGEILSCSAYLQLPPLQMKAKTEVHVSSLNVINTPFSEVSYRDEFGSWYLFDQNLWDQDFPYSIEKIYPYQFRTFRMGTKEVYLPLIFR